MYLICNLFYNWILYNEGTLTLHYFEWILEEQPQLHNGSRQRFIVAGLRRASVWFQSLVPHPSEGLSFTGRRRCLTLCEPLQQWFVKGPKADAWVCWSRSEVRSGFKRVWLAVHWTCISASSLRKQPFIACTKKINPIFCSTVMQMILFVYVWLVHFDLFMYYLSAL